MQKKGNQEWSFLVKHEGLSSHILNLFSIQMQFEYEQCDSQLPDQPKAPHLMLSPFKTLMKTEK